MPSTSFSALTAVINGVSVGTAVAGLGTITASGETCTITGPGGAPLDFNSLLLRITNTIVTTDASLIVTLSAGSTYSSIGQGNYTVTVGPTAATVYIGGKDLETARFLQKSAQSLLMTFGTSTATAPSCAAVIEAIQGPFGFNN